MKTNNTKTPSIELFVSTQTEVAPLESSLIQPVFAGASNHKTKIPGTVGDNTGKNISKLNPFFCELTTQYWATHNSKADYIGFMHYRRFFNFSDERFEENPFGEIDVDYLDPKAQQTFGIRDERIRELCKDYDIITSEIKDISFFPQQFHSIWHHWEDAPHLFTQDLEACFAILEELYPEYAEYVEAYMADTHTSFCNMYILRRDLLKEYNEWLFSILDVFMKEWDTTLYSHQGLRTPGHLAERLWNIWLLKKMDDNPELRIKQLQVVKFKDPSPFVVPKPPSKKETKDKQVIPVVFAADDNYTAMVGVALYSALFSARKNKKAFFDIYIFESDISAENKLRLMRVVSEFANARLSFIDAKRLVAGYKLTTSNAHISNETYYRFLIQEALPAYNKVLYLDSDLLILDDIQKLFDTNVSRYYLAATRDIDYLGNLNMPGEHRARYSKDVLGLTKPYDYFQAGVLVLNTKKLRELHTSAEWLEIAADHTEYIYNDQDILNTECEGKVRYLDMRWNIMTNAFNRVNTVFSFAPAEVNDVYLDAAKDPKIIHYAGGEKPWVQGHCEHRDIYFEFAKRTPFYEELVAKYATPPKPEAPQIIEKTIIKEVPVLAPTPPNLWSRAIDKTLPHDSIRRSAVTKGYHKLFKRGK